MWEIIKTIWQALSWDAVTKIFVGFIFLSSVWEAITGRKSIGLDFIKGFYRFCTSAFKNSKKLEELSTLIQDINNKVTNIHHEVNYNSGKSMKDVISQIQFAVIDISQTSIAFLDIQEIPYWVTNEKGEIIKIGKELCNVMGRTEYEIQGNNWSSWVIKPSNLFDLWQESIVNNTIFDKNYTLKKSDGKLIDVNGYAIHKIDNNKKYIGSIGRLKVLKSPYNET